MSRPDLAAAGAAAAAAAPPMSRQTAERVLAVLRAQHRRRPAPGRAT
jgi:hypothetical protein